MRTAFLAAIVLAGVAGCTSGPAPAGGPTTSGPAVVATPTPTPTPTPRPTPPATDPATIIAADGIGPYVIGAQLPDLTARALVTAVVDSPQCAGVKHAAATGRYAGALTLTFNGDRLVGWQTNAATLVTPSGVRIGMALADVQSLYGGRGALISGTAGNKALSVRVPSSTLTVVFLLDATNTSIASITGGEADPLEAAVRTGQNC